MNLATLAAIRAIVAVHSTYNRTHLLAAIDEDIEHERACQPEVTPMQFEEEESMMGAQIKTTPRSRTWRSGSTEGLTEIGARL